MALVQPHLTERSEYGVPVPVLVWRLSSPMLAISSGPLGGGLGVRDWVLNATVPMSYDRPDPDVHLGEIATALDLPGCGAGLMTGVDVAERVTTDDGGALAVITVGLGAPAWAAAPDGHLRRVPPRPDTINSVVWLPVRLSDAAMVNVIATIAEAKAQALAEIGVEATGTASDATCVLCPLDGPAEPYGGPRSTWGARVARAVCAGIRTGGEAWQAGGRAWSDRGRGGYHFEPREVTVGPET